MRRALALLTSLMLTITMVACSTKKEEEKPENVQQMAEEESNIADDFDTRQHYTVSLGDYTFEVPNNYRNRDPYYYAEVKGNTTGPAYIYLYKDDSITVPSYELLNMFIGGYIDNMLKDGGELLDRSEASFNGVQMCVFTVSGTFGEVEGVSKCYVFRNPSDSVVTGIFFTQANETRYDHFADFDKIVGSIATAE